MGVTFGPSKSHSSYVPPASFNWSTAALGSTVCGGRLFCKSGGIAWIVAPAVTEVCGEWNGSSSSNPNEIVITEGDKPCVSDWSSLSTALTNAGLTPSDWFVPSITQLQSGYDCRSYWDSYTCSGANRYWSSTEANFSFACGVYFLNGNLDDIWKIYTYYFVRAFRCVTY